MEGRVLAWTDPTGWAGDDDKVIKHWINKNERPKQGFTLWGYGGPTVSEIMQKINSITAGSAELQSHAQSLLAQSAYSGEAVPPFRCKSGHHSG